MPFINGREYDHSSCRVRMGIVPLPQDGVKSISYSHGREGEAYVHGTSAVPLARTRGQYKPGDISLEMYKSQWDQFRTLFGPAFLDRSFEMTVETQEIPGPGFQMDLLRGCKIKNVEKGTSEGGEAAVVKLTLSCMLVIENGQLPMLDLSIPAVIPGT
jgi:hypothetical protein